MLTNIITRKIASFYWIMKKYVKNIYILIFFTFIIVILIWFVYFYFVKLSNYKSYIEPKEYFAFSKGYVYNPDDTVFLTKFCDKNSKIEIRNLLSGEELRVELDYSSSIDYSNYKFNELNCFTHTDCIIPTKPGIYLVILKNRFDEYQFGDIFFVNDNSNQDKVKIKVVLSDYTWIAYNEFGGRSNYKDFVTPNFIKFFTSFYEHRRDNYPLNIFRPNLANSAEIEQWFNDDLEFVNRRNYHCVVSEIPLLKFLYSNYDSYSIEILDCNSFEEYKGERENFLFIFNGHSEYWSDIMIAGLNNLKEMNNILFFSGNNIYRKVKRHNNSLFVVENIIDQKITSNLTGLYYSSDGYMQNSSFKIVSKNHLLFKGIHVDEFGGDWVVSHETDKITINTPTNSLILAKGRDVACDLILVKNNKYYLLNTGSVGSYNGLKDRYFAKFIKNYISLAMVDK